MSGRDAGLEGQGGAAAPDAGQVAFRSSSRWRVGAGRVPFGPLRTLHPPLPNPRREGLWVPGGAGAWAGARAGAGSRYLRLGV